MVRGRWRSIADALAYSLSKWHWWSWQHGENMYPEEGKDGYERPDDAKALEVKCLGRLVEDLDDADGDPEYDAALDGVDGALLTTKDVALVKAARDAVGETVDDDEVAALGGGGDGVGRRRAVGHGERGHGRRPNRWTSTTRRARMWRSSSTRRADLKKAGDLAHVKTRQGQRPCFDCTRLFLEAWKRPAGFDVLESGGRSPVHDARRATARPPRRSGSRTRK